MTLREAVFYLELAALLHRSNPAVKKVAKRLIKRVHPNLRPTLGLICQSKNPLAVITLMASEMSGQLCTKSHWPYPGWARPPLRPLLPQA